MSEMTLHMAGVSKRRSHPKKKPFYQRVEVMIGPVTLLVLVGVFLYFAPPYFKVQRVLFDGVHMLNESDVLNAALITSDDSILFLDSAAIQERVQKLPYVKRCDVKRIYPNQVLLRITERKANACVMLHNRLFEIDRDRYVLRELTPFSLQTGPLITNLPDLASGAPGAQLVSPELEQALALWDVFLTLPLSQDLTLSELSAESPTLLRMFFEEIPYEIRWGRSDFETQANRLNILWNDKQGKLPCNHYLDLRFDADLVCK